MRHWQTTSRNPAIMVRSDRRPDAAADEARHAVAGINRLKSKHAASADILTHQGPILPPSRRGTPASLWRQLRALVSGSHVAALIDQAVVSGTSFLASIMIARFCGASQLGLYAIAMSIVVTLMAIQESLIMLPYTIQKHRPIGTAAEYAGASLAFSGMFSATSVVVVMVAAFALYLSGAAPDSIMLLPALAALVPVALAREFARQFGFAHLKVWQVLAIDAVVAAVQLAVLGWLGLNGYLSGLAACMALFSAYALAAIGWLILSRREFAWRMSGWWTTARRSWSLGRWLLAGQATVQLQSYIIYWILIIFSGASMTGVYAACMSIIAFANPIVYGLGNILTPKSVLAWKNGGGAGLLEQAVRDLILLGALMAVFSVTVIVAGGALMHFLYRGSDFQGYSHLLVVLALGSSIMAIGMPASNGLVAMERARAVVTAQAAGAAATVVLVSTLMFEWGLFGAAFGVLGGSLVSSAGRWIAFLALVPRRSASGRIHAL